MQNSGDSADCKLQLLLWEPTNDLTACSSTYGVCICVCVRARLNAQGTDGLCRCFVYPQKQRLCHNAYVPSLILSVYKRDNPLKPSALPISVF